MKWFLIIAILFGAPYAVLPAQESLGTKIKKVLEPSPTPSRKHRKKKSTPTPAPESSPKQKKASATASPSPTSKSKSKRRKPSPTPAPEESPSPSPAETETSSPTERPASGKKGWPNVSLSPDQIQGYENYPPKVKQILDAGLALAKQNLGYSYGSADPKNGGMDCSGFIYYVLQQNGFPDVPRDSSQQYVWVRKAGNFDAVISRKEDSFELDALKPGDAKSARTSASWSVRATVALTMENSGGVSAFSISRCRHRPRAVTPRSVQSLSVTGEFPA